ncbi:MAG: hypothetical protein ACP5I4_06950, partial [Oceanipulchritudo sp.]
GVRESQLAWSSTEDNAWRYPALFGLVELAENPGGAMNLIGDSFPDTDRFNGSLPDEARWVQTAATVEGVTAEIVSSTLLDGNALEVANTGWAQWTMAAFPRTELINIGDQLILTLDVAFPSGGLRDWDSGFIIGFLDQAGNPVATVDSADDFGNYGTGKSNGWSTYFAALATGTGSNSTLSRRGPIENFQGWWYQSITLGAFSGAALAMEDTVYTVSIGIVKSGENEIMLFMVDPETGEVTTFAKDAEAVTNAFDAIGLRGHFDPDNETPPVYQVDNVNLVLIENGPVPGSGTGGEPVVLIDDDLTDPNRFDGDLPSEARWVLNNTDTYGAEATIQQHTDLASSALVVRNGGVGADAQALYTAFPRTTLQEVGDQLVLEFDVDFETELFPDQDSGFIVGFLDQQGQDMVTLGSTSDFANIGGFKGKMMASYSVAFATGAGFFSQVWGRGSLGADAANNSSWWAGSEELAFTSTRIFDEVGAILAFRVKLQLVRMEDDSIGLFFYNNIGDAYFLGGVDETAETFNFDALSFRLDGEADDGSRPVFALDDVKLTFIPQGDVPEIGGGGGGATGDRGTPPDPVEILYAETPFGQVVQNAAPYVYNEAFGWMYTGAGAVADASWFYIWDYGIGWVYTTAEIWPFIYNVNRGEWTYYFGMYSGIHWFHSFAEGSAYSVPLQGRIRFVATTGTDGATGTLADPIRTIQEAVDTAQPGDYIYIRGGLYEESVNLTVDGRADAPITISAYSPNGRPEKVILSAFESITPGENGFGEWEVHEGEIYKIQIPSDFPQYGYGARSLTLANGKVVTPARTPNTVDYWAVTREDMMKAVEVSFPGSLTTYTHPLLEGFPSNAWRGAYMHLYPRTGWYYQERTVASSEDGSITFQNGSGAFNEPAIPEDPFLLTNALPALDQPDEAFFDFIGRWGPRNTLYVWLPDGTSPNDAEMKFKRWHDGFKATDASHYNISHFNVLAGRVLVDEMSSHIHFTHLDVRYGGFNEEAWTEEASVEFNGNHNSLIDSVVLYSDYSNTANNGMFNTFRNNVLGYGAWQNHARDGRGVTFTYNTVFQCEGGNVVISSPASVYSMNHVYIGGVAGTDIANMNGWGVADGEGTIVSYNWVHGAYGIYSSRPGANGGFGIRTDAGAGVGMGNFRIFHNVVWDVTRHDISSWGQPIGAPLYGNTQNYVYHNTVEDEIAIAPAGRNNPDGTYVRNNIMLGEYAPLYNPNDPFTVLEFNVIGSGSWGEFNLIADGMVMDFQNQDFTLHPDSPAIDFGGFLDQGVEQDYTGDYPDAGAYEYGVEPWYPGARVRWVDLYDMYLVDNGDGSLSVEGFPMGRKPTPDFTVRLGIDGPQGSVTHHYNSETHFAEAVVDLDLSGLSGAVDVYFSLDGISFVKADLLFAL